MTLAVTNVLLAIIICILVHKWFYPVWKAKKARDAQTKRERMQIEVEPYYQQYLLKGEELRAKYDPEHKWPKFDFDAPGMPTEYKEEIAALTEAYKGILVVRFGDHILLPK